jgi:hypothetical protein
LVLLILILSFKLPQATELQRWRSFNDKIKRFIRINGNKHRNTLPALSCVRALNCLQNSIIFTPLEPKAGPTGGEGLAAPPLICSLIIPAYFFGHFFTFYLQFDQWKLATGGSDSRNIWMLTMRNHTAFNSLFLFNLHIAQL